MATISKSAFGLMILTTFARLVVANPAAAVTEGPQAYVSFTAHPSFSTLKPCAQGCLQYNGVYHCSLQGYWDLGKEIKCGCSPQNYCFCDAREGTAVTSYINKCVATQCTLPGEVSAVLDVYNGYCATANTALAATSSMSYTFTGVTSVSSRTPAAVAGNEVTSKAAGTKETASTGSQVNSVNQSGTPKPALGLGAIIGIAVGGVVLIAALLCAGCCLLCRRRKDKKKAAAAAASNQGFSTGANVNTPATNYVTPVGGAAQLDGKPGPVKIAEKPLGSTGGSTTVSPLQTPQPTPQPVAATMHEVGSGARTGLSGNRGAKNGAHEVPGNHGYGANIHEVHGNPQPHQNAHEMGANNGYHPRAHEMYGGQHNAAVYRHEVHGNDGRHIGSHEMYGNHQHPPNAHEMRGVRRENGQFSPIAHDMAGNRRHDGEIAEIYTHSPRPQGATLN